MSKYVPGIIAGIITFAIVELAFAAASTAITWGFWILLVLLVGFLVVRLSRRRG